MFTQTRHEMELPRVITHSRALAPDYQDTMEILLVEDNITERPFWDGVCRLLGRRFNLEYADNYELAEQMLIRRRREGSPYDLMVLDVYLSSSKQTGIDLWMRHGDKGLYSRHPVLFVSSANDRQIFDLLSSRGYGERPPYFLQKPLRLDRCVETIERLLWWCF